MSHRIDLARGMVNHDQLVVELIEPADSPPFIAVNWPSQASIATPASYPAVAATITRIIAESATRLAQWKAHGK